jgi:hypothetical protein
MSTSVSPRLRPPVATHGTMRGVMLSAAALTFLAPLKYRAEAERLGCYVPLGGIYWDDEIPDFDALVQMSDQDQRLILRLFSIRFALWAGAELSGDDRRFFDAARSQIPEYPLFRRLTLTAADQQAQKQLEEEIVAGMTALLSRADDVEVTRMDGGGGTVTLSFDLTKG